MLHRLGSKRRVLKRRGRHGSRRVVLARLLALRSSQTSPCPPARGALAALATLAALGVACGPSPEPTAPAPTVTAATSSPPAPTASASSAAGPKPFACTPVPALTPGTPKPPAVDTSAALKTACDKLERAARKVLDKRRVKGDDEPYFAEATKPLGRCVVGPKGAWLIDVRSNGPSKAKGIRPPSKTEQTFALDWELVHVSSDGKPTRTGKVGLVQKSGSVLDEVKMTKLFDLDGDGVDEVLLDETRHDTDESNDDRRSIVRLRAGKVEPYPGTEKLEVTDVLDVDGDGRMDLVLESPFVAVSPCGLDGIEYKGPKVLAHTQADGSLAMSDAWARSFARAQCGRSPHEALLDPGDPTYPNEQPSGEGSTMRIGCALLWGLGPDEVVARIRREYPHPVDAEGASTVADGAGSCVPRVMLERLTEVKPPFVLDGCPGK